MSWSGAKLEGVDAEMAVLPSAPETKDFKSEATLAGLKAGAEQ